MTPAGDLWGFALAALALAGSPGPANLALAAAGAAFGMRRSLALAAGIIAGVLVVLAVTAGGLTGLVLAQPVLGPAVKIAAVLYMLYLAWAIATAPPLQGRTPDAGARAARGPNFWAGVFLGVGNPKAYAAMAALSSGFGLAAGRPALDLGAKILALLAILVAVAAAWIALGAALTSAFRRPAANRAINVAFALLLLVAVALALWRW